MLTPYESMIESVYITDSTYEKLSVLESCHLALLEGIDDQRVVSTANAYTHSLVIEFLDSVKQKLFKLCSTVLSLLNSYILNSARYLDKYREFLKAQIPKLKEPFSYSYYEYPLEKDYPVIIPGNGGIIENEIKRMQERIRNDEWTSTQVANAVDNMIRKFSHDAIGSEVDVYDLKQSVTEIVTNRCRGNAIVNFLTEKDIDKFVKDLQSYRPMADEIKKTRTNIDKDYQLLKKTYERAIKVPLDVKSITRLDMVRDPELASFKANEQVRFADINVQMTRLFTSFIKIYDISFDTKLQILQERIEINKNIIKELLLNTGIAGAVNTKSPDVKKVPYKYEPNKIKT